MVDNTDVRVLILNDKNHVLLVLERGGPKDLPDGRSFEKPSRWGMPGGRGEPGDEDEVSTALREVLEETGLSVYINENLSVKKPMENHERIAFLGELAVAGKIKINPEEILGCRWFPEAVLYDDKFSMYSGHRQMAKELLRKLRR